MPDTMPINGSEKLVTMITQAPTTGSSVSAAFASSGKTANAPSTNRKPEIVSAGMCLASLVIVYVRNIADTIATSISPARRGCGAAAVPLMIASTGPPPKNALAESARPE